MQVAVIRPPLRGRTAKVIAELAPEAPPCFDDQAQWVEYLNWAEASAEEGMRPLAVGRHAKNLANPKPRLFNNGLAFCRDCDPDYRVRMTREGRCNPNHLEPLE